MRAWLNDRQPPLQPASAAGYVRSLRAFARWCGREYKTSDPLAGLQPPRVDPTPVPVFSPEQLRALLEAAPLHLAYTITLLADTLPPAREPRCEVPRIVSRVVFHDLSHVSICDWPFLTAGGGAVADPQGNRASVPRAARRRPVS